MSRPLRLYEGDGTYFVTARTFQGRLFFRGTTEHNDVLGGVLAKAAQTYKVDIYAFVFASNHVHLLVRARDGALSAFMQYLLGNTSRKIGKLIDWHGSLWERRFSAEPVLDDEAVLGRFKYILAHGVKEGLVRRVEEWPLLSSLHLLLSDSAREYHWYNWSRRWMKGRLKPRGQNLLSEEWAEKVTLTLAIPAALQRLSVVARRALIAGFITDIEREGRAMHKRVLGIAGLRAQSRHARPRKIERSPRPPCHAANRELRLIYLAAYRAFVAVYSEASARFRHGDWGAIFPPYAFRPSGFSVRLVAT